MLYKNEKRTEGIKIKMKPSMVDLSKTVWEKLYPWIEDVNHDALFEQLITIVAANLGVIPQNDLPQLPEQVINPLANIEQPIHYPETRMETVDIDYDYLPPLEPVRELPDNIERVSNLEMMELLR